MNVTLKKDERDALTMLLLTVTGPAAMTAMGFRVGGPEFMVAMKVVRELQRVGEFDPDCDAWGAQRAAGDESSRNSIEYLTQASRRRRGAA